MRTPVIRSTLLVMAGLALVAAVFVDASSPAQARGYLRAAPYGYYGGPYGYYGGPYGYYGGPYGYAAPYGAFMPYGYEYYLPSDQHRFYDRNSTDFNS
jgi:hypothetical protein